MYVYIYIYRDLIFFLLNASLLFFSTEPVEFAQVDSFATLVSCINLNRSKGKRSKMSHSEIYECFQFARKMQVVSFWFEDNC